MIFVGNFEDRLLWNCNKIILLKLKHSLLKVKYLRLGIIDFLLHLQRGSIFAPICFEIIQTKLGWEVVVFHRCLVTGLWASKTCIRSENFIQNNLSMLQLKHYSYGINKFSTIFQWLSLTFPEFFTDFPTSKTTTIRAMAPKWRLMRK